MKPLEMTSQNLELLLDVVGGSPEWNSYKTKAVYCGGDLPSEWLAWHVANNVSFELEGYKLEVDDNLRLFLKDFDNSLSCPVCGLEASFWALQRSGNRPYHLNLWGLDAELKPRLFTKDHVVPKSKGGANHLSNYKTMCMRCNGKKADKEV